VPCNTSPPLATSRGDRGWCCARRPFLNQAFRVRSVYLTERSMRSRSAASDTREVLFQGDWDMRGHPHGPFNRGRNWRRRMCWGEVREGPVSHSISCGEISAIALLSLRVDSVINRCWRRCCFEQCRHSSSGTSLERGICSFAIGWGPRSRCSSRESEKIRMALWLAAFFAGDGGARRDQSILITQCSVFISCRKRGVAGSQGGGVRGAVTIAVWQLFRTRHSPARAGLQFCSAIAALFAWQSGGQIAARPA